VAFVEIFVFESLNEGKLAYHQNGKRIDNLFLECVNDYYLDGVKNILSTLKMQVVNIKDGHKILSSKFHIDQQFLRCFKVYHMHMQW
jgi:hypothetical protein